MGATNSTRKLTVESIALLEMLEPNAVEVRNKALLQGRIQAILVKQWPTCRVLPFGSSENGLSFGGSDLDLGIYFEDAEVDYQNHLTTDERLELLSTVCACLGGEFEIQEFVQHARVPVVKLWDPKTQIACDVCLGSVHVLLNTALLKRYGEIDPRVRPLAFAVKYWAKQRGISDSVNGTLSSYGFALLLIFYLQSQSLLPPVGSVFHSILSEKSLPRVLHRLSSLPLDGLRPSFGSCEEESVGALLEGFFRFYTGEFSLEEDVVSVRTGKPLRKELTWTRPVAWRLSIEDPFELNHDVGRVIFSPKGQELLTNEFQRAYDMVSTGDRLEDVCAQDETVWSFSATCYICSAGSHKARECGQVTLGRPDAGRASAVPDCWYCGQSGHVKSTCPLYAFVAGSSPVRRSIDHEMAEPTRPTAISSPVPIPATHTRVYDRSSPVRLVPAVPMHSPVRHGKKKKRPRQGSISSAASSPDQERSRKYMLAVAAASRKCGDRAKRVPHTKFTGIRCVS